MVIAKLSLSAISHVGAKVQLSKDHQRSALKPQVHISPWTRTLVTCLAKSDEASCFPLDSVPSLTISPSQAPCLRPLLVRIGQTPNTPSSDLNSILDAALSKYKKKTGRGLLEHPLAAEVKRCDSIGAISAMLQGQAREFQQFRDGDQRLMKWIDPMVDVLFTFSETLGGSLASYVPEIQSVII